MSPTRSWRRAATRLLVVATVVAAWAPGLVSATPANAAITTAFAKVYSTNTTGDIMIRGNTVETCLTGAAGCAAAQQTAGPGGNNAALNNNAYTMQWVDVDGDASTFDSSSSTVNLPSGASVLFAQLVWGGTSTGAPTPAAYNQVQFKVPGGSYNTVTGSVTASGTYMGWADVTTAVQAAGSGSYTVGNVQTVTASTNQYGGWALVIAYRDTTAPMRNLSVFRGYGSIGSGESQNINVTGFTTPPSGQVKTTLGAVSWEGDMGSVGDQIKLGPNSTTLANVSDALHDSQNVFNSTLSDKGVDSSVRNPSYPNQLGFDAATFAVNGFLPNGSSAATIQVSSSSETYYPGIITFATELYAPKITSTKSVAVTTKASGNTQSGIAEPGDTLTFTIDDVNNGDDGATGTVLTDGVPVGTTYVPGSMTLGGTALSDANDSDVGKYSAGTLTVNLGTGATSAAGGAIALGASAATLTFQVTVNAGVSDGAGIVNTANVSYSGLTTGLATSGASNLVSKAVVLHRSNLSITKTASAAVVQKGAGAAVDYTLTATNAGPYDSPSTVVTDTLPAGAVIGTVTPSAGSCSTAGQVVTCQVGTVVNGGTATVHVFAVMDAAASPATDTAHVSGGNLDDTTADQTATASTQVNNVPVANADTATTAGGTATVNVVANDTDADGNTLTLTGVSTPAHGSVVVSAGKAVYTAAAGWAGSDSFTYTVSDGNGGTATGTVTVTIPNTNPTAVNDATSTTPGTAVDVPVLANDTDPNIPATAQALAISGLTQPTGSAGTVAVNGSAVHFTPAPTFTTGSTTFTYTVSDGAGGTSTATVTVTMANVAPVAADDTATTTNATAVTTDVLANDTDDNGDTLTVTAVTGAAHGTASIVTVAGATKVRYVPDATWAGVDTLTYTVSDGTTTATAHLTVTTADAAPVASAFSAGVPGGTSSTLVVLAHASDPNNDPLTVTGTSAPGHGSVVVKPNGDVVYTPIASWAGADSFTYTVDDGRGGTSTATVSLTVANQAPKAVADTATVPVNGSVIVPVLSNDSDPNNDALTVSVSGQPTSGTATAHANGTVTYQPAAGFEGTDTFSYTVSDGHGGTDSATVTVTVANQPPVAQADTATATGAAGTPVTVDVLANDTDPNNDPLTLQSVSQPLHGTTTIVSGKVVYTPDATYAGPDSFGYVVGDGRGGLSGGTVTVTVVNRNPVAAADSGTVLANHGRTYDVLANDSDPDGETLTLTGVSSPTAHGTASISGGLVHYTPQAGYLGPDTITYTITDPRGGTATGTVSVDVVNAPPVAQPDSATLPAGAPAPVAIDVLANDSDANGDSLTLVAVTSPAHGTVTISGGQVVYTAASAGYLGTDTFDYTVSDGHGGLDTATVTILGVNHAPTAGGVGTTTPTDTAATIDVSSAVADPDGQSLAVTVDTAQLAPGATATVAGSVITYHPAPGFAGTDHFTYTVDDGHGGTATATATVVVLNASPVTAPDLIDTAYATPVTVNVLGNDSDPNLPGTSQQLAVIHVAVDPAKASAAVDASGSLVVTPLAGFVGTVAVSYDVVDGAGGSTPSTLTVTVAAPLPAAQPDSVTTRYRGQVSIDVLGNDDSGTTYSSSLSLVPGSLTTPVDGQGNSGGTVAIVNGAVLFTPSATAQGTFTFSYTVTNALGGQQTETVTVTVQAPVEQATSASTTLSSGTTSTVLDAAALAGTTGPVTIVDLVQPDHGATLTVSGGTITVHRVGDFQGTVTATFVVVSADGTRTTVTETVHLQGATSAPVTSTATPHPTATTPTTRPTTRPTTTPTTSPTATPAPPGAPTSAPSGPREPSSLPFTGLDSRDVMLAGLVLLLLGGALVRAARRSS